MGRDGQFQLAGTYKPAKHEWMWDSETVGAEEKFDGIRIRLETGTKNRLMTRNGIDRGLNVKWLADLPLPSDSIYDAELIGGSGDSCNNVASLMAQNPDGLRLVVFDIIKLNGESMMDKQLSERRLFLVKSLVSVTDKRVSVAVLHTKGKRELLEKVLARGGEGIMLKPLTLPYKWSSRTNWFKVKATVTVDCVITDCDGRCSKGSCNDLKGWVGLSYGFYLDTGKLKTFGTLGFTGEKEKLKEHVGKVAEVKVYGMYETGQMRHPVWLRFRDDKSPEECTLAEALNAWGRDKLIKKEEA